MNSVRIALINGALQTLRIAEQNLGLAQKNLFELLHALNSDIEPSNGEIEKCISELMEYETKALELFSIQDGPPKKSVLRK